MSKTTPVGDRVDLMFRAFSDRTRLRILCLLREQGELCVGDIIESLRVDRQSKASQHLAFLRKAGLVVARKSGLWSYYSLAPARGAFHEKLLECLACCFQEVPQVRADQSRAKKLKAAGGCCPGTTSARPTTGKKTGGCCPGP